MEAADFAVEQEEPARLFLVNYKNVDEFWNSQRGSGPVRFAIKELGEEKDEGRSSFFGGAVAELQR